jgi:hypothetical protein
MLSSNVSDPNSEVSSSNPGGGQAVLTKVSVDIPRALRMAWHLLKTTNDQFL